MKFKITNVLFFLIVTFLLINSVYADAPSEITINGGNLEYISAADMIPVVDTTGGSNDGQNLSYKVTTNGDVVYCINPDKLLINESITYTKGEKLDYKILYLMENGYPGKSITGDNQKDYFITNLAIWKILAPNANKLANYNFENGTYKGQASPVVASANALVASANYYGGLANNSAVASNINITNDNVSMTLSSDGKYYVSPSINVTLNGSSNSYTVKLNNDAPTGTKVTDNDGNEKTNFDKGEKFIVKVPVSSVKTLSLSFSVSVSSNFLVKEAYAYNPPAGRDAQAVVLATESSETKSDSMTLNIGTTTKVKISKQDATTGKELPGALLVVKDSTGKEIDRWTSTSTPHEVSGLSAGTYTLTEITAPKKYVLNKQSITFTVKSDGTVDGKIVMKNYLDEVTTSPQTGTTLSIISIIVSIISLGFAVLYLIRLQKVN